MSDFSDKGDAVRYRLLKCKRIACPECWGHWARLTVFGLAVRIEAYARANNCRPFLALFSVPPNAVNDWEWGRVNRSLFRRGYRRSHNVGVNGGVAVFHPYRVKKIWQQQFRRGGIGLHPNDPNYESAGFWKEIRRRAQHGESLFNFVNLGPHIHAIGFGSPQAHECQDYVIRFFDNGLGSPIPLTLKDIIGLLFYLITHTGVLNHLKAYKRHGSDRLTIRRQQTHTIRAWGDLHHINPKRLLGETAYQELCKEIAELIGMGWDSESGELVYPASRKDFETIKWIPIYQLGKYLAKEGFLSQLSYAQTNYWLMIVREIQDRGPPIYGEYPPPDDIAVFAEVEPASPDDMATHPRQVRDMGSD